MHQLSHYLVRKFRLHTDGNLSRSYPLCYGCRQLVRHRPSQPRLISNMVGVHWQIYVVNFQGIVWHTTKDKLSNFQEWLFTWCHDLTICIPYALLKLLMIKLYISAHKKLFLQASFFVCAKHSLTSFFFFFGTKILFKIRVPT